MDWTNVHYKNLEIARGRIIDKYWMRQWIWSQLIEEQLILKHPLRDALWFLLEKSGCDPKQFCKTLMDNLPMVEDVLERKIFIYKSDTEDGVFMEVLARRSIGNYENTVNLYDITILVFTSIKSTIFSNSSLPN